MVLKLAIIIIITSLLTVEECFVQSLWTQVECPEGVRDFERQRSVVCAIECGLY